MVVRGRGCGLSKKTCAPIEYETGHRRQTRITPSAVPLPLAQGDNYYCEITGIVRRDGATDGTGPHPTAGFHDATRQRGRLAAGGPRGSSRRAAGRTVLPAQRDVPHSDGVIP
jgi:hypothetical protein